MELTEHSSVRAAVDGVRRKMRAEAEREMLVHCCARHLLPTPRRRPPVWLIRVTLNHLCQKHRRGDPITVVTAYGYPSAVHVDTAGIDICLVGDSAAMVVHGHDTTLSISLDEMLVHCCAVALGASRPLLVGDLLFGSSESLSYQAVDTAVRVLKEGGMDEIKLEGGAPSRIAAARSDQTMRGGRRPDVSEKGRPEIHPEKDASVKGTTTVGSKSKARIRPAPKLT